MAVSIEISYFNSIVIAGGQLNYTNGGSPGTHKPGVYHIEENRIKGEFNGKQMIMVLKHISPMKNIDRIKDQML